MLLAQSLSLRGRRSPGGFDSPQHHQRNIMASRFTSAPNPSTHALDSLVRDSGRGAPRRLAGRTHQRASLARSSGAFEMFAPSVRNLIPRTPELFVKCQYLIQDRHCFTRYPPKLTVKTDAPNRQPWAIAEMPTSSPTSWQSPSLLHASPC